MNRVSDAIVRRNPESVDFFVIDKTNAPKIDQDRLNRALGVARVVETNPGLDDVSSSSSLSKYESIISNNRSQTSKKFVPKEGSGLLTLKEKIERQKATRAIVPQLDCANANAKPLTRKVASTSGPSKYLGFNTDKASTRDSTPKRTPGKPSSTLRSSNTTIKKTQITEMNTTTRKTSKASKPTITTSSWRDSQKKAKEILKNEKKPKKAAETRSKSADVKSTFSSKDSSQVSAAKEISDAELYKDLSPEVQAIVADLKLDETPQKGPTAVQDSKNRRARSYTPKRPARRNKSPEPAPTPKKKHNYDQSEIQEYMKKKKQQRLKENESKTKLEQEKQAKIDAQLKSLREAQLTHAKSKAKAKPRGHSADSAKTVKIDSVAKAMKIINELDEKEKRAKAAKMSRRPKSAPPRKTSKPKAVDDLTKIEAVAVPPKLNLSSSRASIVSIEKVKTPATSAKASPRPKSREQTPRSEISDGSRSEKAKSILGFIQSSIENLDFHNPSRPPLVETQPTAQPKARHNAKQSSLLQNLKAKSENINKLTDAWESKLENMAEKREREHAFDLENPPGVKSLEKLVENTMQERLISTDSLENQAQMPEPVVVQAAAMEVHLPVYKLPESTSSVENLPPLDINLDASKKSSQKKKSPKKTRKPVKFVSSSSPDEFNMVDLMFREEQARRKALKKRKQEAKLSEKDKKTSLIESEDVDSYSEAKFSLASSGKEVVSEIVTPRSQVLTSRSDGFSTKSTASLRSSSDALVSASSKASNTKSVTASVKDSKSASREHHLATSVSESVTDALSSLATKKTVSQTDTAQISEDKYSSFSETDRVSTTVAVNEGEALKNALTAHLKLSEGIDENIRALDEAQSKKFLEEMREIQQKGAKAAELMLKASQNFAKGSRMKITDHDPISSDITPTRTSTRTGMVDDETSIQSEPQYTPIRGTDPSYSEAFTNPSEVTSTQRLPTPSLSATKTQSISDMTKSKASSIDETSVIASATATPVSQTSTIVTVTTAKPTEDVTSSSTTINEESYASTFDDLNESAKILTPSMEYRKKIPEEIRKRLPSEASDVSTDLDTSGYDAFTNFMADMVRQYVSNEKSSREKFHKAMMQAKEKAIRDKKKKKISESDTKRKSKKSRGDDDKMPTREQLEHSITLSESDTSTSTINRVKKWFNTDEKHLTQRESQLQKRRKKAEKLIAWKKHLDEQEKSIMEIESEVTQAIARRKISNESEVSIAESAATDTFNGTSETDMDSSDHEARLKALQGQCQEKEKIVAKLRRTLKKHAGSRKQEFKAQEAAVQKQIEALDEMIEKAKEQLDFIENNKEVIVKPIIKSPQTIDRSMERSFPSPVITSVVSLAKDSSPYTSPHSSRSSSESESQQKTLPSESEPISEIVTESIKNTEPISESQTITSRSIDTDLKSASEPLISLDNEQRNEHVSQSSESQAPSTPTESDTLTSVRSVTAPITESIATAPKELSPEKSEEELLKYFTREHEEEHEHDEIPPTNKASMLANTGDAMATKMIEGIIEQLSSQQKDTLRENLRAKDFTQADDILSDHSSDSDDSLTDALLNTKEEIELQEGLECNEELDTSGDGEVFNYFQHYKVEQEQKLTTEEVLERADAIAELVNNSSDVPPVHQDEFDEALYDVCQEIAYDLHLTGSESKSAILKQLSQFISPNGPDLDRHIVEKMGRRSKKDRVDRLLIAELRQDEKNWIDYSKDEMSVRDEMTSSIMNYLLDDTVQALKERYSVAV